MATSKLLLNMLLPKLDKSIGGAHIRNGRPMQGEEKNTCKAVLCGSSLPPMVDKAELCVAIHWQNHLLLSFVYCNKTTARKGGDFMVFALVMFKVLYRPVRLFLPVVVMFWGLLMVRKSLPGSPIYQFL